MKIAIAGFGQEGRANYEYWNTPENDLTIVDERDSVEDLPNGVSTIFGEGAFSKLADFDMVVRTAGLRPDKIVTDGKIWSATNEFFARCPAPIIGVTGTKGKGTTCSLTASILHAAGKTVHLVGNIGVPGLPELASIQANDIVVYEMSSFQLWDLEKSPHIAVVLMIEPDHMDVHASLQEYVDAKARIVESHTANDIVIYHPTNEFSRGIAERSGGIKMRYGSEESVWVSGNQFVSKQGVICEVSALQIPGVHNKENACAAIAAVFAAGLDQTFDQAIAEGLHSFTGLEHRLKLVGEVDGVRYYDDSIATTPGSAMAALRAFPENKVIILGGHDKGADYTELVNICKEVDAKVVAVGQVGKDIANLCNQLGVVCEDGGDSMQTIVAKATEIAQPGDVVILSPAAASFGMFKNYKDRGEQFVAAVTSLQTQ